MTRSINFGVLAACACALACVTTANAQPPLQHQTVAVEIGDAGTGSVRLQLPAQVFVVEGFSSLAEADCLTLVFDGTEVLSASAAPGEEILVSAAVHDDIEVRIAGAEPNRVHLARLSYRVFDEPAQAGDPATAVQPAWRAE